MYCWKCGKELPELTVKYCPFCGADKDNIELKDKKFDLGKLPDSLKYGTVSGVVLFLVAVIAIVCFAGNNHSNTYTSAHNNNEFQEDNSLISIEKVVNEIDITHGGKETHYADMKRDIVWRHDFNWAEYDEDWDKISPTNELDIVYGMALGLDSVVDSFKVEMAKNYIETRLKPDTYKRSSYWDFCPSDCVAFAEVMWKQYLDDHEELKGMYIEVGGIRYYPYTEDDFCLENTGYKDTPEAFYESY
ncbi:MAG: zinc ribbon domain-containing protein [Lachnospiraceae bacterium]|nr:zinc ribbon domain-containing protein [Lachnospiraceae bacterium]